ncbi:hypothetical protein AB0D10_01045 [Kitasatospora sp. NPDC048545]|uniref:hypothetical protein n=1 Tax=Kitasatospora sp. NPDC048545 TaxID=3157208 RepID=UPI0033D5D253
MGRHRRPPEPALPDDADQLLDAIAAGQPIVEEGVVLLPGSTVPYGYRNEYRPDGTVRRELVRLAPGPA